MRQFLFLLCLSITAVGYGQNLDTIYSNQNLNTALFFPERIRQAVVGRRNFLFSYNEEFPQYFGLLKALPGPPSNLLVVTTKGEIFSYVVAHRENLSHLIHFFDSTDRIGMEAPVQAAFIKKETIAKSSEAIRKNEESYRKASAYYLKSSNERLKKKRKNGIALSVDKFNYNGNQVYLVFTLENRSRISFQVEYLRVYLVSGSKKRNSSFQKVQQVPLFIYKLPDLILHSEKKRFVYVLPKFTNSEHERVEVELREKRGSRSLTMSFR